MFSYKKLFKLLIDKEIKKSVLLQEADISRTTGDRLSQNKYVEMSSLDKICNYLDCGIEDIVEHIKD